MNSFYTILYTPIRPAVQEQLSIGLFLTDGKNTFFHHSMEKLAFAKQLLPSSSYYFLKSYLSNLETQIKKDTSKPNELLTSDFVSYLSSYNNNLITFSKPTPITIEATFENFKKLYEKFIFEYDEVIEKYTLHQRGKVYQKVYSEFYPKIKERVNLEIKLSSKYISHLLVPTHVDFIGKNENPVAGQTINFDKGTGHLSNELGKFISLIKAFELNGQENGKYYLIGVEPEKKEHPAQHDIWNQLVTSGIIDFVPVDETEKISKYLNEHNVAPFVEEVSAE
jgi:hypothetical protein